MAEYLKQKGLKQGADGKCPHCRSLYGAPPEMLEQIVDRAKKAELKAKYYEGKYKILIEKHRGAFEYMNGLYMKVLGKLREAQGK